MEYAFRLKIFSLVVFCLVSNSIFCFESFKGLPQGSTSSPFLMHDHLSKKTKIPLSKQSQSNLIEHAVQCNFHYWPEGACLKVESLYEVENGAYKFTIKGSWKEQQLINHRFCLVTMCRMLHGEIKREELDRKNIVVL